jgi:uncharacterized membrane protein
MEMTADNAPFKVHGIEVNRVRRDAHWTWMQDATEATMLSLMPSLKIGAGVVGASLILLYTLWSMGLGAFIPAAYGAFAIIGPVIATLIYGISRKLEDDGKVKKLRTVNMRPNSPSQVGFIGFTLLILVMAWALMALLIYALTIGGIAPLDPLEFISFALNDPRGLLMGVLGTIAGVVIGIFGFTISAISIPLAFDRDIDALSAMAASTEAVMRNPTTMFSWAFVISVAVALSAFFAFLPMIIIFPWLGHVTWKAYRDLIN